MPDAGPPPPVRSRSSGNAGTSQTRMWLAGGRDFGFASPKPFFLLRDGTIRIGAEARLRKLYSDQLLRWGWMPWTSGRPPSAKLNSVPGSIVVGLATSNVYLAHRCRGESVAVG